MTWSRSQCSSHRRRRLVGRTQLHVTPPMATSRHGIACSRDRGADRRRCGSPAPARSGAGHPRRRCLARCHIRPRRRRGRGRRRCRRVALVIEELAVQQMQPGVQQLAAMAHDRKVVAGGSLAGSGDDHQRDGGQRRGQDDHQVHRAPACWWRARWRRRPCTGSRWRRSGSAGRSAAARSPRTPPSTRSPGSGRRR